MLQVLPGSDVKAGALRNHWHSLLLVASCLAHRITWLEVTGPPLVPLVNRKVLTISETPS